MRSKVDRVSADRRGSPEVVSVDVYVSAGDGGRGAVWRGWRYLGLASVALALVAVVLISSVSSRGIHSRSASSTMPFSAKGSGSPGARYQFLLVGHPYFSRDAKQLMHRDRCAVSRSAALERVVETLYARAVADAQGEVLPGRAKLQATKYPMC